MRIVIAPDSFKGSLTSPQAAAAIASGLRRVWPQAEYVEMPLADGGEGTAEALVRATGGWLQPVPVTGPAGGTVIAQLGWLGDGRSAVIECAQAAGLTQVPEGLRNPLHTTTYGLGQLVLAALAGGAERLLFGLGGSATNDAGAGMLQALGLQLLDAEGQELPPGGAALARLARVVESGLDPRLAKVEVIAACDVDNPLTGPRGASHVYGPQKGATPEMVAVLDQSLAHFAAVARPSGNLAATPGAGAAGGLGFGLLAFLGATLKPGAELVCEAVGFDAALQGADLLVTGEGRFDATSAHGKLPVQLTQRAARAGVASVVLAGSVGGGAGPEPVVLPIVPEPVTLEQALAHAANWLADAAERLARLLELGRSAAWICPGR